ncbi:T7SS effector LXG polymorphic toxin [Peribacillus loiseleuriae]|uniref:T7SS effector LXG polymorphic toxin n=1 Tax=Peribacillus loiseleuriae TaxID=1679170 RepID=UPI003D092937
MNQIKEAVTNLIALEDSLKGEGRNAIRGFYEECHKPFLLFYPALTGSNTPTSMLRRIEEV